MNHYTHIVTRYITCSPDSFHVVLPIAAHLATLEDNFGIISMVTPENAFLDFAKEVFG